MSVQDNYLKTTDGYFARLAPLLYAAAGWAHINFIVPAASAPGPAEVAVIRSDGTLGGYAYGLEIKRELLGREARGAKPEWCGDAATDCDRRRPPRSSHVSL